MEQQLALFAPGDGCGRPDLAALRRRVEQLDEEAEIATESWFDAILADEKDGRVLRALEAKAAAADTRMLEAIAALEAEEQRRNT